MRVPLRSGDILVDCTEDPADLSSIVISVFNCILSHSARFDERSLIVLFKMK